VAFRFEDGYSRTEYVQIVILASGPSIHSNCTRGQETVDTGDDGDGGPSSHSTASTRRRRRRRQRLPRTVVNPDENFYFYWLFVLTVCVLYNLWTLIVRQSFPELQQAVTIMWFTCDGFSDTVFLLDIAVQFRTGYLEQGLMVISDRLSKFVESCEFGAYTFDSRALVRIFYYLLSEAEGFIEGWAYPYHKSGYQELTRKYLGSLYWSTLTLTTIGDLPTPETNAE
ncbi:hypothetical protein L9F63_019585, partial [Diploptera punctata]